MPQETLGNILDSVAKQIHAEFEQSRNFKHNGESGTSRELLIKKFLSRYIPSHVEAIHNAEVISANGKVSPQSDILIIDRGTPPFTTLEGYRIIPNECVYGLVEVKTKLDRKQLTDACEKIAETRSLPKTAYRPIKGTIPRFTETYGRKWDFFPTSGLIVAFGSIKLETLGRHLMDWCRTRSLIERPDSVWVIGKGYLQWGDPRTGTLYRSPREGASLFQVDAIPENDILLALALHLNIHFSDAWMNPLSLTPYSGNRPLGHTSKQWDN
ncbi:DUF6602 domain-containing protein [Nocardiopsis dassonvillei]|uniref:DUF6602 domain-containing protein n=1 Tax=Nocardiopsis dassonvillei TaxID=2014 RepID=UPI00157BF944|nr:DUF6602 domain-containing protein [Nocardiopsis dassonvillei]